MNFPTSLISLFFPVQCAVCEEPIADLGAHPSCQKCWRETKLFSGEETLCSKCGKLHSYESTNQKVFCRECDDHFYDFAASCGIYESALSAAVISLKNTPRISNLVARALFERYVTAGFSTADLIIPVPLSKRRSFERGFNQAEIISTDFANTAGIELDTRSLKRSKHTVVSRASMDPKGRETSVSNAFVVKRRSKIKDKNILLIDDVLTTGATASMAAKALKKAGAKRVEVLTIARAGKQTRTALH